MSALRRLLPILILVTVPLAAQTTGSISGHVTDTSGAAVPGVTVEATSSALQGTRVATSDINGLYRLPQRLGRRARKLCCEREGADLG